MLTHFKICNNLDQCLSRLSGNPKLAVAISREHVQNNRFISTSQFYCFESENIYEYDLNFLVGKNIPFSKDLNEFIRRVIESGLIKKWHSDSQIRIPNKYINTIHEQLDGVFLICYTMIVVVIFIFILEKIVYTKVRSPNTSRYWKFIEMLIDPDRHFWLENQ